MSCSGSRPGSCSRRPRSRCWFRPSTAAGSRRSSWASRWAPPRCSPSTGSSAHRSGLLLAALTIHNVPEGIAVGLAFAAGGPELGIPLALAIGIQNIPEGFAAAAPLLGAGKSRRAAADLFDPLLAGGLGFAAGAMLYVIADELIPESQSGGNERAATLALLVGFALMMVLDNAFG
jgi:ZIP family zinc transporter